MSRTLHKRPVDDLTPLKKSHARYWNREDYMECKVPYDERKRKVQRQQDLDED